MPLVKCGICLKEFYIKPSHQKLGWGKYCSATCRAKAQNKGKFVKCNICKKEIYRSPRALKHSKSSKYFCSKSCQTLWRNKCFLGQKSRNWKNGKSTYRNILKRITKEQICSICGIGDKRILVAHHIDHIRVNNLPENLIWLCLNCHYLVHHDKELDKKLRLIKNGGVCRTV